MEEVAYTFHFQPSELERMKVSQLLKWHNGARNIHKKLQG
jgi:Phage P2 GpE